MKDYSRLKHRRSYFLNHQKIFLVFISLMISSILLGLLLLKYWQAAGRPDSKTYPILGVSLSQEDGYQDFHLLKKHGINFVYLKATQGADYFDDQFLDNIWRIQGSQIPFGVYHYFSFTSTPQRQFANFTTCVGQQIGNLPLVIQVNDYQTPRPSLKRIRQNVLQLSTLLVNYYQRSVIIQTTPTFAFLFKNKLALWIQRRPAPAHNSAPDFWEYSDQGKIPSLASTNRYHLSVFVGNEQRWQQYIQTGGH